MADEKKPAPAAEKKKPEGPQKRPSALKRDLQNEKRRLSNRSYRAKVLTAVRGIEQGISEKQAPEMLKQKLSGLFSLMDKGVKHGVFKVQKAARTKSRMAARLA